MWLVAYLKIYLVFLLTLMSNALFVIVFGGRPGQKF